MRRRRRALVAAAAVGVVAAACAAVALAFSYTCTGTSCSGSTSDSFSASVVCQPGVTPYFEDSFLPSDAQSPQLTKFQITPNPPCTGATVSGATVAPFPASNVDPDGVTRLPQAGEAKFRFSWTVSVPSGSMPVGDMQVNWSIGFTKPTSTSSSSTSTSTATSTSTTTTSPAGACDWVVSFERAPRVAFVGEKVRYTIRVANMGGVTCPTTALTLSRSGRAEEEYFVGFDIEDGDRYGNFGTYSRVRELAPGASETFPADAVPRNVLPVPGILNPDARLLATDVDARLDDESAVTETEFVTTLPTSRDATVSALGKGALGDSCGLPAGQRCTVSGTIDTGRLRAAEVSAVRRLGTIRGSVRGGRRGTLTISLNAAGRRAVRLGRSLNTRMTLTTTGPSPDERVTLSFPLRLKRA